MSEQRSYEHSSKLGLPFQLVFIATTIVGSIWTAFSFLYTTLNYMEEPQLILVLSTLEIINRTNLKNLCYQLSPSRPKIIMKKFFLNN